jgi:hypothetical protein
MKDNARKTLYESSGYCPLFIWIEYYKGKKCQECPFDDGVDIGVGWLSHCGNECGGKLPTGGEG